ncbi:MAG TPA: RNA polymerase sigma factor [Actinomycetota bacterium]|nr:RNA polymerase sigma factor [Actinomycetota bacterium]
MTARTAALPPFQVLLDSYKDDVHRFLVGIVGADADDCFQETFLAALRAYPALSNGRNLKSWLLTIAHRKAIDRHRARRTSAPLDAAPEPSVAPADPDPALWAEVAALPDKQRAAVVLRFVNDMAYRDIGVVLDCSEEAARRSTHEGVKRLREVIER